MSDQRRRPWRGAFDDPWRKLLSVALAVVLWYYLDRLVTAEIEESIVVVFSTDPKAERPGGGKQIYVSMASLAYSKKELQDGDRNVPLPDEKVVLTLKGAKHEIDKAKKELIFEVQRVESNVISQDQHSISFRLEDLKHPSRPEFDGLLESMTPATVRIVLQKNASETLPLTMDNVDLSGITDEKLRARIRGVTFKPPTVTLFGAKERVDSINNKTTLFRANFTAADVKNRKVTANLARAPGFEKIQIQETPTAEFQVDPEWQSYTLEKIPVVLDTAQVGAEAGSQWEAVPKEITLKIRATGDLEPELFRFRNKPPEELRRWVRSHARVRVYLREADLASTATTLPRQPTLQLFRLTDLDAETTYERDVDYVVEGGDPTIEIKKKGN